MNLDPADGRPVEIVHDLDRLRAMDMAWYHPERPDLWRFGALLPLDIADAHDRPHIVALGEGYTPELPWRSHGLAAKVGFRLAIKEEGRAVPGWGANPTQSFKDRGMAMTVSMARKMGLSRLAVPTQGNAGDALATYGVAGGLEVAVVMARDTPLAILGKVAAYTRLHPGQVHMDVVEGTIREAGALVKEKYLTQGFFSVATFQEPGWRIEGKKTMGLELAEPRQPGDGWSVPDVVVYPTGGGTGILGMWKAFGELEALGLIDDRRPRMVCVQSEGTAPLVRAFEGRREVEPVEPGHTIATGLDVAGGVGLWRVLEIVRKSGGVALSVSEAAIAQAMHDAVEETGWWISPEGGACLAALEPLVERGTICEGDRVVVFNTGSYEKYLPDVRPYLPPPARSA